MLNCDRPGANCSVRVGTRGFDLHDVPTQSSEYMDFVKEVVETVGKERDYRANVVGKRARDVEMMLVGLSVGAVAATYANVVSPGTFERQILINPWYGAGVPKLDEHFKYTLPLRVLEGNIERIAYSELVVAADTLPSSGARSIDKQINHKLDEEVIWYENCEKIFNGNRKGFCAFQVRHGAAVFSFGLHTLVKALSITNMSAWPSTQIITSERDGMSSNGFTYKLARHFSRTWWSPHTRKTQMCMYRWQSGTSHSDDGRTNCLPHAPLDPQDNANIDRWWEKKLFDSIEHFIVHGLPASSHQSWNGSKNECVSMPLGIGAFLQAPWLGHAVLPAVAPRFGWELRPSLLWKSLVLHLDTWARVPCKIWGLKRLIGSIVDCSVFDE